MKKLMIWAVILLLAGWLGWRLWEAATAQKNGKKNKETGAAPVAVAPVEQKAMPVELRAFGNVEALATVAVKAQVTGLLSKIHIAEGQDVQAGDLLFTIDPRPQQAARQQAEANVARDRALLRNASKESARQKELLQKGLAAEDTYDAARTAAEALTATVQAEEAALTNAQLQLEYCFIHASIGGRTGDLLVREGNLVKANDVHLLTIHQIHPILVRFSVPQQDLPRISQQQAAGPLAVAAYIAGDDRAPERGHLTFIANEVDRATGTITLKGTFPNERPGLYVNVVLTIAQQMEALVVPARAIQTGQQGTYVFVIKADQTADLRLVRVDRTLGTQAIIARGLQAGEQVVTDGHLRLLPGARVTVKKTPDAGPATTP
ncbi:MAG: efflux RND transporter periplasmic adaptor subunit [Kiritimatiellaeota bacterium]|nr:efflux RND transporter periplasmic adaptor subunit [Kiritimatiellota bacterium]